MLLRSGAIALVVGLLCAQQLVPVDAVAFSARPGRRARQRARGKLLEPPSVRPPAAAREGSHEVASVSITGQNVARISYMNGTVVDVHTPTLEQTQHGEWLSVRAALEITASEFSAARDAWRHASRATLLDRKMGKREARFRGNAATAFGLQMEPRAVRQYEVRESHTRHFSPQMSQQICAPSDVTADLCPLRCHSRFVPPQMSQPICAPQMSQQICAPPDVTADLSPPDVTPNLSPSDVTPDVSHLSPPPPLNAATT